MIGNLRQTSSLKHIDELLFILKPPQTVGDMQWIAMILYNLFPLISSSLFPLISSPPCPQPGHEVFHPAPTIGALRKAFQIWQHKKKKRYKAEKS